MAKSQVALLRCLNYDQTRVDTAVRRGVDLLGGIGALVKPGDKIVLKPNLLWGADASKCITTHPAVFQAVGKLLLEAGAKVFYGDSPSFSSGEGAARRAGLKQVADALGITWTDFENGCEVSHQSALLVKKLVIAKGVIEADGLISLSKLKTHALVRLTGAVKNQFGCIPGILKAEYHVKLADPYDFASMLVDINTSIRPRLYVMDAVMGMEGNGPHSGQPRQLSALLVSSDPVALDAIASRIVGLNPAFVPTALAGEKAGLGSYHQEQIEVLGDSLPDFIVSDFQVVKSPPEKAAISPLLTFIRNRVSPRPVIDSVKCNACGTCVEMCPVGPTALDWTKYETGKRPRYRYNCCIRCYCCQEICPEGAIVVRTPLLGRLAFRQYR